MTTRAESDGDRTSGTASAPSRSVPLLPALLLGALLAVIIHVDWHLARPAQYRLSLGWSYHWIATAIVVALIAWLIARWWPDARWRVGAAVFVIGALVAQGAAPVLEMMWWQGHVAYSVGAERWAAFGRSMLAAAPAFWGILWLTPPNTPRLGTS